MDERGRRFWDFRPARPEPYDVLGISLVWWLVFWAAVIAFAVWAWPA